MTTSPDDEDNKELEYLKEVGPTLFGMGRIKPRVPEGYFETLEAKVLESVSQGVKRKKSFLPDSLTVYVAVAAAVLAAVVFSLPRLLQSEGAQPAEVNLAAVSDTALAEYLSMHAETALVNEYAKWPEDSLKASDEAIVEYLLNEDISIETILSHHD